MLNIDINSLKNQYIENALAAKKAGYKIYIYGASMKGQIVAKEYLEPNGVHADFFVETDKYYGGSREVCGIPVIPYSKIDVADEKILLLVAYDYSTNGNNIPSFDIKGKVFVADAGMCSEYRFNNGFLDAEFYSSNKDKFELFYESLADKESKNVMEQFLKARITGDFSYLKDVWRKNQYFDSSVINLTSIKSWVDCGAYIGDTYEEYLKKCPNEGISYLFEPDEKNIKILKEKYSGNQNMSIVQKGAWSEKTQLSFADDTRQGVGGFITSDGLKIEVDSIDNVLNGKQVDFIKMDIEGSEYNALLGAKNTILNFAPTLAICVYHKRDDLLELPKLIKSFRDDYNFYLRIYKPYSTELVLYAVKK